MSEELFSRLDKYVQSLLADAEGDGTTKAEGGPGPQRASLADRVSVLKAVTSYIELRGKQAGGDKPNKGDEPETPEIVRFEQSLKRRARR